MNVPMSSTLKRVDSIHGDCSFAYVNAFQLAFSSRQLLFTVSAVVPKVKWYQGQCVDFYSTEHTAGELEHTSRLGAYGS